MSVINAINDMFSYAFITRAVLVGALVALCASVLGVILVLKRYSMIGDGLSHVSFGAMAIALAFNAAPLKVAIPIVIIAAFLLLRVSENSKIKGDSAIGLVSSSAIAIGVIINVLSDGANIELDSYMFGNILALDEGDVMLGVIMCIFVMVLFLLFYHNIFAITFDEDFAKATGVKVNLYKSLLSVLTAMVIVIGMRIMGTLLISSLMIFPALTSMRICKRFKTVMITSVCVSLICFFMGMLASYMLEIPTGASIVVSNLIVFLLFSILSKNVKK